MSHLNESYGWVIPISVTIALTVSANFDIRNGILKSINQCSIVIFLVPSSGRPERRTDQLDFYCSCCFPVLKIRNSGLHGQAPDRPVTADGSGLSGRPTWITGFESSLFLFWSTLKTKFDPSGLPTGLDFSEHKTSSGFNIDGIRLGSIPNSDWQSDAWYWYGTHFVWSPLYVT